MFLVLVLQLLDKSALGRAVGGQLQRTEGQGETRLRTVALPGPGQFVVGVVAEQPGVFAVIAGGDGDGTLGGHGEARVERVGHRSPPVVAGADGSVIAADRQRHAVGHALGGGECRVAPVAEGVEAPAG
ncbi:hypothetical protein D9M71_357430 [compost metagenome]